MKEYLTALRGGIKGELDSITVYRNALENNDDAEVRSFLENRIEEEKRHYNQLVAYMNEINDGKPLSPFKGEEGPEDVTSPIITKEFATRIAKKQILFSALSTAALLEKNAMEYYRKCAEETDAVPLKSLFTYLSHWESKHYDDLLTIQKEAEEEYWRVNRFEPF